MSDDILHTGPAAAPAEAVQPSNVAPATPEGTGASEPAAETDQQRQERLSTAGRDLAAARKQNQAAAYARHLQKQNDELQRALLDVVKQRAPEPAKADDDGPPDPEKFPRIEDYWKAVARHESRDEFKQQLETLAKQAQAAQVEQQERQVTQAFFERMSRFAGGNPDFHEAVQNDSVVVPKPACEEIIRMHDGPEIMLAIHREPGIAEKLHGMGPGEQKVYLGKLSAFLQNRPPQVSQAPAPGTPVTGKSSATLTPETATNYDDFVKVRRKQIAARKSGY
jgi:hypothetical protein